MTYAFLPALLSPKKQFLHITYTAAVLMMDAFSTRLGASLLGHRKNRRSRFRQRPAWRNKNADTKKRDDRPTGFTVSHESPSRSHTDWINWDFALSLCVGADKNNQSSLGCWEDIQPHPIHGYILFMRACEKLEAVRP